MTKQDSGSKPNSRRRQDVLQRVGMVALVGVPILVAIIVFWPKDAVQLAPVPFTGQTRCFREGSGEACAGTGEDGENLPGVHWPTPRFSRQGDVVTDHLTGLVWSWDVNVASTLGGSDDDGRRTWEEALSFVKDLNAQSYAGYDDWRLPNANELLSLIDWRVAAVDGSPPLAEFDFSQSSGSAYWTSTTIPLEYGNRKNSWTYVVFFQPGHWRLYAGHRNHVKRHVWPVRGPEPNALGPFPVARTGQTECFPLDDDAEANPISCNSVDGQGQDGQLQMGVPMPQPRFVDNGHGTVRDRLTDKIWMKTTGSSDLMTWEEAFDYVEELSNAAGATGCRQWRVPNILELHSLFSPGSGNQALQSGMFVRAQTTWGPFWSSTTAPAADKAWVHGLSAADQIQPRIKDGGPDQHYVWPVCQEYTS